MQPALTNLEPIPIAVVGAHLSGMPLNRELVALGATLLKQTVTEPHYRLYALTGEGAGKPGLLRIEDGAGFAIEIEIWTMEAVAFGIFVSRIPPPLGIGTLRLAGGVRAKGFLVEAEAVRDAVDISSFGGWKNYQLSLESVA